MSVVIAIVRAPPAPRATDLELVIADAYDASIELEKELAPGVHALDDRDGERVAWIGLALSSLPVAILAAASAREARGHHLDRAIRFATSIRIAIEILDATRSLPGDPVRARARTVGILARLRDARGR